MSDYNNKTEDSSSVSSRFEHKSQGMRSQSLNEKKSSEESIDDLLAQLEQEDKTIRISSLSKSPQTNSKSSAENSPAKTAAASADVKLSSGSSQARGRQQKNKADASAASRVNASSSKSSYQGNTSASAQSARMSPQAGQSASSKVNSVFKEEDASAETSSEGLGVSVFVSKSDIPAYEIGLSQEDYYIPKEIKSGKVSKISPDQLDELEADAKKKKKKSHSGDKKQKKKKKLTPAQKAIKAVIWVAAWLIVFLIAFVCYRITYNVFYDVAVNPDSTSTFEYTVTADATDESVYEDLCELGVMNCTEFIYKLRAKVFDAEYIEGTYTISDGYNTEKIINILAGYVYSSDDDD